MKCDSLTTESKKVILEQGDNPVEGTRAWYPKRGQERSALNQFLSDML
jgi:hypothetical protein